MSRSESNSALAEHDGDGIDANTHQRVPVAGGVLVYERQEVGRELVGVEGVTNWTQLADAVAARGHGRGDALHLPILDPPEGSA